MKRTNKFTKASLLGIAAVSTVFTACDLNDIISAQDPVQEVPQYRQVHQVKSYRILLVAQFRLRQSIHTHSRLGAVPTGTRKSTLDSAMIPKQKVTGSAITTKQTVVHQESFGQYSQAMNTAMNHCNPLSNIAKAFAVRQPWKRGI